jgi:2-oxoglutarate dehydrogenase E2 component (dihydrolipoamide succinyltransferase)
MSVEIKVPSLGESVSEAIVSTWFKQEGDAVVQDQPICELETDKVTLEVNATATGVLKSIVAKKGAVVQPNALLGVIEAGAAGAVVTTPAPAKAAEAPVVAAAAPAAASVQEPPAVRKIAAEQNLNLAAIPATGKDGRHTKGDVLNIPAAPAVVAVPAVVAPTSGNREERVKMTKLRQAIARRLKDSQNTAAILTTFNEVDMSRVMALRNEHKDAFEKKFGIRLGFMGLFVKAAVQALKEIPEVNAHIDGDEIVYKNHYDIGVAVGTEQGLVVPVVRGCEFKTLAQIEGDIIGLAKKARDGQLGMSDMAGGTFTITNGGVYGSLMSTPIINPPQSAIMGMHKVEDRPVVVNGQIVIRPMMYLALSYDHRIIDGRESVTFLKRVKEMIEDPARLAMGI